MLGGEVVTLDTLVERVLGGEVAGRVGGARSRRAPARRRTATVRRSGCGPSRSPRRSSAWRASATARVRRPARWSAPRAAMPGSRPPTPPTRPRSPRQRRARRGQLVVRAAERLERELAAWGGAPVFAYGFDDLSPAQLRLLAALAGRCDVLLALPYEPGRPLLGSLDVAFEWLAARAERVEELRAAAYGAPAERGRAGARGVLGAQRAAGGADGAVRLVEAAGTDGEATAVAAEVCRLLRLGLRADEVLVVTPGRLRLRAAGRRARARRRRGGARYERAPHEPACRSRAAQPLPRGLVGR